LACNVPIAAVKSFTKKDQQLPNELNLNNFFFMKKASFVFNFDTPDEARVVASSLDPEIKNKIPKTNVTVSLDDNTFTLEIEAKDISSLRAACNSYLRWINTALKVKKTI
jgi:tRNA threonylcarbamoyladenosine modification (KEOPS) complex  Pcc1 subunit